MPQATLLPTMRSSISIVIGMAVGSVAFTGCSSANSPTPPSASSIPTGVGSSIVPNANPNWANYRSYLDSIIQSVQKQWYQVLEKSRKSPPYGSHVVVTFKLNSRGETEIVRVEDAGAGKAGVEPCLHAIQNGQPYPAWTKEMIALLGNEQELSFAFSYQ